MILSRSTQTQDLQNKSGTHHLIYRSSTESVIGRIEIESTISSQMVSFKGHANL
nr:MAG TPA: hypothetical protein [Myoviridae sp. ctRUJ25]